MSRKERTENHGRKGLIPFDIYTDDFEGNHCNHGIDDMIDNFGMAWF